MLLLFFSPNKVKNTGKCIRSFIKETIVAILFKCKSYQKTEEISFIHQSLYMEQSRPETVVSVFVHTSNLAACLLQSVEHRICNTKIFVLSSSKSVTIYFRCQVISCAHLWLKPCVISIHSFSGEMSNY